MKKILFIALAVMTATSVFALPPPKVSAPKHGGGPSLIPKLRDDFLEPHIGGVSKSPNNAMANAVAISGFAAMGARMIENILVPPQPTILVFPDGEVGPVIIQEMEPVVTHPVPISPLPIEVIKSK